MRAKSPALLWLGAVAAAGVIGFGVGKSSAPLASAPANENASTATAHVAATSAREEDARAPSPTRNVGAEADWTALRARPNTPERDRELAEHITRLARSDPHQALALANAEKNWNLRQLLRDAAVKGWASVAPDAAADWVMALKSTDRRSAVAALFEGASSQQPAKALQIATRVIGAAPESSSEIAHLALDSLGRAGAFQTGAALATQLAASDASLLTTAYLQWSEREPDAAVSALQSITDPALRRSALQGVVDGWALADPEQLAERAQQFPAEDRPVALSAALSRWAERDPIAAADWIETNDPGQEADDGVIAVSEQSSLVDTSPETALHWTGLIVDPAKRTTAQQSVLARWAERNPAAARQFAEALPDANERAAALAIMPRTSP